MRVAVRFPHRGLIREEIDFISPTAEIIDDQEKCMRFYCFKRNFASLEQAKSCIDEVAQKVSEISKFMFPQIWVQEDGATEFVDIVDYAIKLESDAKVIATTEETIFGKLRAGEEFIVADDINRLHRVKVYLPTRIREDRGFSVVVSEMLKGVPKFIGNDIPVLKVLKK